MSTTATAVDRNAFCPDGQLAALALEYGTPLYVYDLGRLRKKVLELQVALARAQAKLYFATMANDSLPVLRALAKAGLGACVNSMPHLELAREAGFAPEQIQFTSTGITHEDMRILQRMHIQSNIDSLAQLEMWFGLGGRQAGIRVNAASIGRRVSADRIGVEAAEIKEAIKIAARRGRQLTGLHIYVGTNFQHAEDMLPTLELFFEIAASVQSLSYVNVGGGIGIDYKHKGPGFDMRVFGEAVAEYAKCLRAKLQAHIDVIVEPGRSLTAECGTFLTSVTDVKKLDGRRFAAVDGSIAIFPRPFHHPETPHCIRQLTVGMGSSCESAQLIKTVIVGRTTFSRDILGSALLAADLQIGDLLALDDAGAYSQSMASRFLGQPEARAVFLDN